MSVLQKIDQFKFHPGVLKKLAIDQIAVTIKLQSHLPSIQIEKE